MTTFAQFDYVHFELGSGDHFSVLLRDSDKLSHVLHASDRLAYLPSDRGQSLSTIGELLAVLIEVRVLFLTSTTATASCSRQLHQISQFFMIHLHD